MQETYTKNVKEISRLMKLVKDTGSIENIDEKSRMEGIKIKL